MRTNLKKLTATREDYIRAVYLLQEFKTEVGVTDIAEKLKLSKSTVSERLKELVREKFVEASHYTSITLTKKGLALARSSLSNIESLKCF